MSTNNCLIAGISRTRSNKRCFDSVRLVITDIIVHVHRVWSVILTRTKKSYYLTTVGDKLFLQSNDFRTRHQSQIITNNMRSALGLILSMLLFVLPHESTSGFLNVYPKLKEFHLADGEDPGAPLFLTPLIESGKVEEARKKAVVEHDEMYDISSYSGYFTVNKEYNSNLFFWFFPAMVSNH